MTDLRTKITRYPALALLVIVYALATAVVVTNVYRGRGGMAGATRKKVLRFAHWQLEPGIRKAMDELMAEYGRLHPDVEVSQILIPEEGYFQWVNTQLIGRTAPDMIECGSGGAVGWALWPKFYARYFLPLDRYVDEPNPYNEGTELEGVPWRKTYFDEMDGGYSQELQSYFQVPLSVFTVRLYYNKDLIEKVWGAKFPTTFGGLIELCKALEDYGRKKGVKMEPVAGSWYNFRQFFDAYRTALTADYLDRLDTDWNGTVTRIESAAPIYSGALSMMEPAIVGNFELVRELSQYFPPGFSSLDRDEAVFLFLQGYSAMITTGSWDYQSLAVQSEFRIGIADIPLPSRQNPRYGAYVAGPRTEAGIRGGFRMGITKASPNADVALDFLRFASSLKQNEKVNRAMYWLPVIKGARPRDDLKPFAPRIEGYTPSVMYDGPGVEMAYEQLLKEYLGGKADYKEFVGALEKAYRRETPGGVEQELRNGEQTLAQQMRFAALQRAALSGAPGVAAAVTGDSRLQYKRIMEAHVTQIGSRFNDIRVWVDQAGRRQESGG